MSDSSVILRVQNVSRKFSKGLRRMKMGQLEMLASSMAGFHRDRTKLAPHEFWAVDNVSFDLRRGESLALLGLNGSGKSTLLKMIHGLLMPTKGEILTRGRQEALIELGTGFHVDLSGRENLEIRTAMTGKNLTSLERRKLIDEMIEFSEIKDFIDMPIGRYSSGMYARLGFSASVFIEPDLLLIDEVLSVGDFKFRQKCLDRLNSIRSKCAIIFVSHSMATVRMFCRQGLVMEAGKPLYMGNVEDACSFYLAHNEDRQASGHWATEELVGPQYQNSQKISDVQFSFTSAENDFSAPVDQIFTDQEVFLSFSMRILDPQIKRLAIGIPVWLKSKSDSFFTAFNSDAESMYFYPDSDGWIRGSLRFKSPFLEDEVVAGLAVHNGPEYLLRARTDAIKTLSLNPRYLGTCRISGQWMTTQSGASGERGA